MYSRAIGWTLLVALGLFRPGVDRLDRWLVSSCWDIPSQWNSVADAAIRTGVVDGTIAGKPAPWRQASIHTLESPTTTAKIAVVTVSDMRWSRVTFITDRYQVLGSFERITAEPTLITDEARGYKALSHVWPIVLTPEGRLHTLIAFSQLGSKQPNLGLFAYIGVGPEENDLLFVCLLRRERGQVRSMLSRLDLNGDGFEDFGLYPYDHLEQTPMATFTWNPRGRTYVPSITDKGRPLISWWSTTPASRVTLARDAILDEAVGHVALAPAFPYLNPRFILVSSSAPNLSPACSS